MSTATPTERSAHPHVHGNARELLRRRDFLRLLGTRLSGQFADGIFQASLAGTVLFNPERQAHAADIAAGFAVLLLPYSILGPFCGVLLDRWSRQRILTFANLLRCVLVVLVATEIAAGVSAPLFYLSALLVISVNRFVLSALSACLPHTVPPQRLITANAMSVTAGALVTATGGGLAIGLRNIGGTGNAGYAAVALASAVGYLAAGLTARGFARRQLGPDEETRNQGDSLRHVVRGLIDGGRHVRSHPSVVRAFTVIGLHRFAYGVTAITTLLLYRNYFHDDGVFRAGLVGLGQVVLAIAVGGGIAAAVTPAATRRWGSSRWAGAMLVVAGIVEWSLGLEFQLRTFLPAAAVLGFVAQGVKICVDTLVAQRVADDFRGRVFSLYDTLFNVLFVGAGVLTAVVLPETGRSTVAVIAIGAVYLVVGAVYFRQPDSDLKRHAENSCADGQASLLGVPIP